MPENVWMWFYCTLLIPKNCWWHLLPIMFKHILLVYKNWIMWWRHICGEGQRSLQWPTQTHICFYGTRVFPLREQLADTPHLLQRRAERRYEGVELVGYSTELFFFTWFLWNEFHVYSSLFFCCNVLLWSKCWYVIQYGHRTTTPCLFRLVPYKLQVFQSSQAGSLATYLSTFMPPLYTKCMNNSHLCAVSTMVRWVGTIIPLGSAVGGRGGIYFSFKCYPYAKC